MTKDEIVQKATFAYEDVQGGSSVLERMTAALDKVWQDIRESVEADAVSLEDLDSTP